MSTKPRYLDCDAYLFDIDGTLLNVRDATHYHAFHHAVKNIFGVDSHIDGVPVHGNTDIGILRAVLRRAGLADADFEASLPLVIDHMCSEVDQNAEAIRPELCPSIIELLQLLSGRQKLLGVVSGNLQRIGWQKLKVAGLASYFAFGCFCDSAELRSDIFRNGVAEVANRLGPSTSICVVGDTPADILAAREIGVPVIAVGTGIYSTDELTKLLPDACLSSCSSLLSLL